MIRQKRFTLSRKLICLLLLVAFIVPTNLAALEVKAAEKPVISATMVIGTGDSYYAEFGYTKNDFYILDVINPVKKATYSFTSNNKNIVTVKTKGTKAYLTGIKAGTATITCQQKLNGKTTKVGTCKVTVKNTTMYSESYDGLSLGTNEGVYIYYYFRNCKATYSYTSDSKNFSMKEKTKKDYNNIYVYQSYTAKEPGTYTVTVKETYNKKTRVVGKAKFVVKKSSVVPEETVTEQDSIGAYSLIRNSRADVEYFFDIADTGIVELTTTADGGKLLKAKKEGTTTIKIYEDTTKAEESKLIGTCKLTVNKLKLEGLDVEFYDTATYVGGESITFYVYKDPYNAPEKVSITSSNTKVATVSDIDEEGRGEIKPVGKGTTTITITCGEFTKTETITVYADEDEMWDEY